MVFFVMRDVSSRHRRELCRIPHRCLFRLVSTVIILNSVPNMNLLPPTWAEVYQCRDAAGKPVLTNRLEGLNHCRLLSRDANPVANPPALNQPPQGPIPPINSDVSAPPPSAPPIPTNQPTDTRGPSAGSPPAANLAAPPSTPSAQPCLRGVNPLNPLTAPPCIRSDQSEVKPPGTIPTPSQ